MQFLFFILLFYSVVVILKIFWGAEGKNLGLLADGLDSVKNVATLLIAFLFSRISLKERDETHHFGHTKYDSLGAIIISFFQVFVAGIMITVVFFKFGQVPEAKSVRDSFVSFLLMALVVLGVFFSARRYKSEAISAEFWHELTDLIQTAFVLISTYVSVKYLPIVNSIFALFIAFLLLISGIRTFLRVEKFIMDWAPPSVVLNSIESVVSKYKNVFLRENKSLMSAERKLRIELTLQIDGNATLTEAHEIAHLIEEDVKTRVSDMGFEVENIVIHVEPKGSHISPK